MWQTRFCTPEAKFVIKSQNTFDIISNKLTKCLHFRPKTKTWNVNVHVHISSRIPAQKVTFLNIKFLFLSKHSAVENVMSVQ